MELRSWKMQPWHTSYKTEIKSGSSTNGRTSTENTLISSMKPASEWSTRGGSSTCIIVKCKITVNKQDYPNDRTLLLSFIGTQTWPVDCCPIGLFLHLVHMNNWWPCAVSIVESWDPSLNRNKFFTLRVTHLICFHLQNNLQIVDASSRRTTEHSTRCLWVYSQFYRRTFLFQTFQVESNWPNYVITMFFSLKRKLEHILMKTCTLFKYITHQMRL